MSVGNTRCKTGRERLCDALGRARAHYSEDVFLPFFPNRGVALKFMQSLVYHPVERAL